MKRRTSEAPAQPRQGLANRRRDPISAALLLLVVLAVVPLLSSAAQLVPDWVPQGDEAAIVLRGDDLFSSDTPLVGMPSTVGFAVGVQVHHPGPLESQAIGVVSAVVDDPRVAVVVVTLVNLASVAVALMWAYRLGGPTLLAGSSAVASALLWSLRGPVLVSPFNPDVAVLPFLACAVSLVAATERRPWAVTSAVVFGSWAAQAHLTIPGPVVATATAAGVLVTVRWAIARRRGQPAALVAPDRRRALVGTGVLVACWAFPLTDALINRGGNLRAILQASGSLDDETLGVRGALDVLVQALVVRPVWAQAGADPLDLLAPPSGAQYAAAGLLIASALIVAVACRVRLPAVTAAVVIALSALATGGALTTKIPQSLFNLFALHNYLWLWPVTAVLWVAVAAGLAHLAGERLHAHIPRAVAVASAVAIVAVLAVVSLGEPHRPTATTTSTYVRSLSPQVVDALDPSGHYLIKLGPTIASYNVGTGLLRHLERAGYDVRVPERHAPSFGDHRVDDGRARDVLVVEMGRDEPPAPDPAATPIATYRPSPSLIADRTAAERAVALEIQRRDGIFVGIGDRIDPSEAEERLRSGDFLSALRFRLIDPVLAASPPARKLLELDDEPLDHVVVYVIPAG